MAPSEHRIDREAPDRLRRQGGSQLLVGLTESFLSRSPERLRAFRDDLRVGDAKAIADIAHDFKTVSRLVGAMRMGALCEDLERRAKAGEVLADSLLDEIEDEYDLVRPWLEQTLDDARAEDEA